MANENSHTVLFSIYAILMVVVLIMYSSWLTNNVKEKETSIVMIICLGIGYVLSTFLMMYHHYAKKSQIALVFSFVSFVLAFAFMIANHVITQMEVEEIVSPNETVAKTCDINTVGLTAMILGYVAVAAGLLSYIFHYKKITSK